MRERKVTQRQIFTYTTETTKFWVAASALCPSHLQQGPDRVLGRQRQNLHNRRDRTVTGCFQYRTLHEAESYPRTRETSISPLTTHSKRRKIEKENFLLSSKYKGKKWQTDSSNRHEEFWPAVCSTQRDKRQSRREPYLLSSRTMQHVYDSKYKLFCGGLFAVWLTLAACESRWWAVTWLCAVNK